VREIDSGEEVAKKGVIRKRIPIVKRRMGTDLSYKTTATRPQGPGTLPETDRKLKDKEAESRRAELPGSRPENAYQISDHTSINPVIDKTGIAPSFEKAGAAEMVQMVGERWPR
jgi:hypothetical protein